MPEDAKVGYELPQAAGDNWVERVRAKHRLPKQASMEQIEPVATALLANPNTSLDAAELVLNRRVDGKERMIGQLIFN